MFCAIIVAPSGSIVQPPAWVIWRRRGQNYSRYSPRTEGSFVLSPDFSHQIIQVAVHRSHNDPTILSQKKKKKKNRGTVNSLRKTEKDDFFFQLVTQQTGVEPMTFRLLARMLYH